MSLESWKAEFYPKNAHQFSTESDKKCIKAAIKKWKGAFPENCAKHNVRYVEHSIIDIKSNEELEFDDDACTLCVKYFEAFCYRNNSTGIVHCPIIRLQGIPCDKAPASGEASTYDKSKNDPEPILNLLKETLQFVKDVPED